MPGHRKAKTFDAPDEMRPFADKGGTRIVMLGDHAVGLSTFEPGWRWSSHVKPIAKTDSCQTHHLGYVLPGRMKIVMNDGAEDEVGPGWVVEILPGHDAWVVGDEPCVLVDFGSLTTYAKGG